jgi:hypothetical protein
MHSCVRSFRAHKFKEETNPTQAQLIEAAQDEALSRHQRKCVICRHPEREAIEEDFIHWQNVWQMAQDYGIDDYRSIYRHARATGLIQQRRDNFRSALDEIVEKASGATVTGDTVIRAIRAYSCLDKEGRWAEPPKQVVFTVVRTSPSQTTATTSSSRSTAPKVADQPAPSPLPPPPQQPPVPAAPAAAAAAIAPAELSGGGAAFGRPLDEPPGAGAESDAPLDEPRPVHYPPPSPPAAAGPHTLLAAAASTPIPLCSQPRTLIYGTGIRIHANSLKT